MAASADTSPLTEVGTSRLRNVDSCCFEAKMTILLNETGNPCLVIPEEDCVLCRSDQKLIDADRLSARHLSSLKRKVAELKARSLVLEINIGLNADRQVRCQRQNAVYAEVGPPLTPDRKIACEEG